MTTSEEYAKAFRHFEAWANEQAAQYTAERKAAGEERAARDEHRLSQSGVSEKGAAVLVALRSIPGTAEGGALTYRDGGFCWTTAYRVESEARPRTYYGVVGCHHATLRGLVEGGHLEACPAPAPSGSYRVSQRILASLDYNADHPDLLARNEAIDAAVAADKAWSAAARKAGWR